MYTFTIFSYIIWNKSGSPLSDYRLAYLYICIHIKAYLFQINICVYIFLVIASESEQLNIHHRLKKCVGPIIIEFMCLFVNISLLVSLIMEIEYINLSQRWNLWTLR